MCLYGYIAMADAFILHNTRTRRVKFLCHNNKTNATIFHTIPQDAVSGYFALCG
jgi:hypothetical protein